MTGARKLILSIDFTKRSKAFSLRMNAGMKKMLETTTVNKNPIQSVLTRTAIATPSINTPPEKNNRRANF